MRRLCFILILLFRVAPASAGWASEQLADIRATRLDPEQCYRVRDLFLEREDVKFYFVDGHLILARPFAGRTFAALFVAGDAADRGEIILFPPSKQERVSLARFTSEPVLNERFRSAMMFFTDDTGAVLREALLANPSNKLDPEAGGRIAPRWNSVMANLFAGVELSLLADLAEQRDPAGGFFGAMIGGGARGRFEVVIDSRQAEQVNIGQIVWRENRQFYEAWCRFPGKNFVAGLRRRMQPAGLLSDYRIETRIADDLRMDVRAKAVLTSSSPGAKLYAFELSRRLRISELLLDGEPVEFLQFDHPGTAESPYRSSNFFAMAVEQPLDPGSRHEIEFRYEGKVIGEAGEGVYYVGSRDTWYPRVRTDFTNFELRFDYPARFDLVATGGRIETTSRGGVRSSLFRAENPIRMAGFNLGVYERASRTVGDLRVEACAYRGVEQGLRPKPAPMLLVNPFPKAAMDTFPGSQRETKPNVLLEGPRRAAPEPTQHLEEVADAGAAALTFFRDKFGPPATSEIVISPIPGDFGQGFPGLVYAPTISYLRPGDAPFDRMSRFQQVFYSRMLPAHEIAHQWWGNVVTVLSPSDVWLMEALATYSALLLLENEQGVKARDEILAAYRARLLERNEDGETVESAGAIVLGERLSSSKFPNARRLIVYEKGAWVIHMMRGIFRDAGFFTFLRRLRESFEYKDLTTEQFRRLAADFLPADYPDPGLENFFDQWVYDTGIPKLSVDYRIEGKGSRHTLRGRLVQTGVPESFSVTVPVEIHTIPGRSLTKYIKTEGEVTEFQVVLRNRPSRMVVDPGKTLLALRAP